VFRPSTSSVGSGLLAFVVCRVFALVRVNFFRVFGVSAEDGLLVAEVCCRASERTSERSNQAVNNRVSEGRRGRTERKARRAREEAGNIFFSLVFLDRSTRSVTGGGDVMCAEGTKEKDKDKEREGRRHFSKEGS